VENRKADHIAPYFSKEKGSPTVYSALSNMLAIFMPMPNMLNMPIIVVLSLLMHAAFGRVHRKIAQKGAKPSKNARRSAVLAVQINLIRKA
ncbi:MAG: hypothetical protein OXU51_22220, partial [Candidatus Poribacteria bacterium]|nr:hypothetical protein [Candidatus Poribacteria bacterium]